MKIETRSLILDHALKEMPREACGVVIIEKGKEVFVPCRNVSEVKEQFELHAEDYAMAEDRGEVIRIVHSHCYVPAEPSDADRVSCEATKLPWSIVSVPTGSWFDFEPSGYKAPLVGRAWSHGVLDCYSIVRDYYKEILSIQLRDFERDHQWWLKGQNIYIENFGKAGFKEVSGPPEKHDVLLMQIQSPVVNHAAVYLGDDMILHHLYQRLSSRDVYGGYYLKHTAKVLRYEVS